MNPSPQEQVPWKRVEWVLDQILDSSRGKTTDGPFAETVPKHGADSVTEDRLDELCDGDRALRREVEQLLACVGRRQDVLDEGAARALPDLLMEIERESELEGEPASSPESGRRIDRYVLGRVLGRGGMGVVYQAERADDHFEKKVAFKVIPRGLETPEMERRFRVERQILARLEHENIARLLDGGVTADGFPYLVMELIDGEPIDQYCERHGLDTEQRLRLFLDVCGAVEYAHQNLVIHRDLKPGNIHVTASNTGSGSDGSTESSTETGTVKLLDFGVGKILAPATDPSEPQRPPEEESTRFQPMTPGYASPEQRANRPVSTATDIYSLGLVLRRLLGGSTAVGEDESPAKGREALRGDLAVIVSKALREAPQQRFRSVGEMADDIRRYLNGMPIESRPSTWRYRTGKFVLRHRFATATALTAVVVVAGFMIALARQERIASEERDRARAEARKAQRISGLLRGLFDAASPQSDSAGQLTARDLLDRGEARVRSELADQPAMRGEVLSTIGSAYAGLGDLPRSAAVLEEAIEDLRAVEPTDGVFLADALRLLASTYRDQGNTEPIGALLGEALELLRASDAAETTQAAQVHRELGRLDGISGRPEMAAEQHRRALRLWQALGEEAGTAIEEITLAVALEELGQVDEALALKRHGLATLVSIHGDDHPQVSSTRNNIAVTLHRLGSYQEAEDLYRDALGTAERTLGSEHPGLASTLSNLGKVLMDQGRFEEAASPLRRAVDLSRGNAGPDAFNRIAMEINLAGLDVALGDLDEALLLYRNGLDRFERLTTPGSRPSTRVRSLLGIARHRAGDPEGAERLLRTALEAQRADGVPIQLAETLIGLGAVMTDRERAADAEPLLREGLAIRLELLPDDHWQVAEARIELAGALLARPRRTEDDDREAVRLLTEAESTPLTSVGHRWIRTRAQRLAGLRDGARS